MYFLRLLQARNKMRLTAIIECCKDTGLYVGYVPGFAGAHSLGETLDELNRNLTEREFGLSDFWLAGPLGF